ncbi:RagB/SusD family nutrient uptake outer membrane protein [Draconibacterium sp. IB214405]|uniref:RagB/SusD family nutrient uptake outer membrane protein n=1 Tax=Draconibacterium sp. IB214405 TaxID=3097352 RepID=UPI002A12FB8B|nr:RagB/SusD family nutrient uptake outer membrane protein [Draconibacterium sp. IB214405]MDX8340290.1 RagB/SusD family nutrient uptake outer membrane protein [Draconibacterium sp. IB214405]
MMGRIDIRYMMFLVLLIIASACTDFLDEVDQDKLVPEKTDHYAALLLKEFNKEYPIFKTIDYMTDNMTEVDYALSDTKVSRKTVYTWQREIEIDEEGDELSSINRAWREIYEDIAITNYVIEQIDDADGEQEEKDYIKGEAYFVRAHSYFNLLNLYGQPFNDETADADLGVPLRTNIAVEQVYYRNTVRECYNQIEEDLTLATELIFNSGIEKSKWHPDVNTCNLLMSRVKLYQKNWEEAIDFATKVISNGSLARMNAANVFVTEDNTEILYSFYTLSPVFTSSSQTVTGYSSSPELYNLYQDEDARKVAFFGINTVGTAEYYITKKYSSDFTELGYGNYRVSEAYLNRAEAYAQLGQTGEAINDVSDLLQRRYSDMSVIEFPEAQAEVLDFILTERRKELCFEDHHRWFDLRRMENRPEIKHVFTLVNSSAQKYGVETYTLLSDDPNYTLPIPLQERENNPLIRNNERLEKLPVKENL